ncbi:hypothetical protein [Parahaliea mediterranea]|uniref:hypothetical protein n=1 Tax=Parahaliea mediterranea TaxID=651086 RepID=UPI000E2F8FA5|nr:hypothetical protein [Parahaliea mediterranea]
MDAYRVNRFRPSPAAALLRWLPSLALAASASLLLGAGAQAQPEEDPALVACDDKDVRDRGRSSRRRAGGSNRDCEYREVVVDQETGEVLRERPVAVQRNVVPRRYTNIPRPTAEDYVALVPIPDRWRIVDSLDPEGYPNRWWDPYNQNTIKGDKPVHGDWFFNVTAISDTVVEFREVPTPVGVQSTDGAGSLDVLGATEQALFNENLAVELVYYQGDTVFRPPDWEIRFTPVFNYNYTELEEITGVNADPGDGITRNDNHVGIQAAFVDKHLRNVSDRYDFDSLRVGIQPFSSDFRGFLFQDAQLGARLFGTRSNNRFQYNLAWFRLLEKDTNSGLNDVSEDLRDNDVFFANVYWQDMPKLGFFSQATLAYNRSREDEFFYDTNDFIQRPASLGQERMRDYDVYYVGYNGDGHFGRLNLTVSAYAAFGEEQGGVFTGQDSDIEAFFFAAEPGIDLDWIRLRGSFLFASGDDDPFDDKSQGYAAIFENPQFAGADTSYWIRQGVPLIGGGRVALSQRNAVLPDLRSSKEHGQSNFTNPGLWLAGAGVDLDLLPELRLSFNANYLAFAETEVLEVARQQANVDEEIGLDLSAALIWRPFMSQNVVARLSYAQLLSGQGFNDLYGEEDPYSLLLNVILTF